MRHPLPLADSCRLFHHVQSCMPFAATAIGGFLALLMQRCVSADGASEDLRGAGLRAANVFMARSAKAYEGSRKDYRGSPGFEARIARLGDSMQMKGQSFGQTPLILVMLTSSAKRL